MNPRPILIIEDRPDMRTAVKDALQVAEITNPTVSRADGESALDYLATLAPDAMPVFILLDLKMPEMDGFEVLRRLKENPDTKHIPVAVLTGSDTGSDIKRAYALGASTYILKPFLAPQFSDVVRDLGLKWSVVDEDTGKVWPVTD